MLGQGTAFLNTFEQALQEDLGDLDESREKKSDLLDSYARYFLKHFCRKTDTQNDMLPWLQDGRKISKDLRTTKNKLLAMLLGNPTSPQEHLDKLIQVF